MANLILRAHGRVQSAAHRTRHVFRVQDATVRAAGADTGYPAHFARQEFHVSAGTRGLDIPLLVLFTSGLVQGIRTKSCPFVLSSQSSKTNRHTDTRGRAIQWCVCVRLRVCVRTHIQIHKQIQAHTLTCVRITAAVRVADRDAAEVYRVQQVAKE